jgi:PhoPQ-activated pathogenicity-related protein
MNCSSPRFSSRLQRFLVAVLFVFLCGCSRAETPEKTPVVAPAPTALDEYVARAEPSYKWEKEDEQASVLGRVTILKVTSQTWQGRDWTHRVQIITPQKLEFPDTALVLASYGSSAELIIGQLLARQTGATVINVENIPNQPLYGKSEDDLVAHTFAKFLETGDKTWPLLFPMTKSVIAAMDAAQEYSGQEGGKPITKFVVSGASKRGWTAWLVAAADSRLHPNRVTGIIPLVYNNLNIPKQMPYQLESWGKFSAQIDDYTRRGLQAQLSTPRGQELVAMIDPYFYRDRFTMPKLLINGTNDPYWTPDATQFYLGDLPNPTALYFAPNSGHDLGNDYPNVLSTAAEWFKYVARGTKDIPDGRSIYFNRKANSKGELIFSVPNEAVSHIAYIAFSNTRDFRDAKWEQRATQFHSQQPQKIEYILSLSPTLTQSKYAAIFVNCRYPAAFSVDRRPALTTSSQIHIFDLSSGSMLTNEQSPRLPLTP